jgi:hypothetical protein
MEGGGLGLKGKRAGGSGQNCPSSSPSSVQNREGRGERPWTAGRWRLPASRAMATAGRWGKMERVTRGIDSHPHRGSRCREEAAPHAAADWRWR